MLESHETNTDPASSLEPGAAVSRNRVTPEELTQALAQIETRKQAEASRLAGTIAISDAVTELQLNATPEEIWAEVQQQRTLSDAAQPKTSPAPPQVALVSAEPRFSTQAQLPFLRDRLRDRLRARFSQRRRKPFFALIVISFGLFSLYSASHPHVSLPHVSLPRPISVIRPLTQVPDGQQVYADTKTLVQLSEGKPLSQMQIDQNNSTSNQWTLIKVGGHVYLRAYIASADTLNSLQGKPLNIYNDDNSGELFGESTSVITLRVDKIPLQSSGGDSGYSEITVPNFQPDALTTLSPGR